jgi:hypothetical protein
MNFLEILELASVVPTVQEALKFSTEFSDQAHQELF